MRTRLNALVALSLGVAACVFSESAGEDTGQTGAAVTACVAGPRPSMGYTLEPALGDRAFALPVAMIPSPTDASQFYVVEKKGVIRRVSTDGVATVFADIVARVNSSPNEAGLLGFALHPRFATNGLVFLSYTKPSSSSSANLRSVLARAKSNDGGLTLDTSSIVELVTFDQPYSNHNGGCIAFGKDGFLYAAFGDGGSAGDPQGNGQNTNTLLGKMLRIDVDNGNPYAIPADNPFRAGGGKPEIFAYGLRNTWRFSFDRLTGDLWAGDVGQNKYEEIDKIVVGGNYGWGRREARHCYTTAPCTIEGAIDPIVEYDHGQGISVTGGYVYRGSQIPELYGRYLYGDFGSGKIWSIGVDEANPTPKVLVTSSYSIASFAQDNAGELYVLDYASGKIKKLGAAIATNGIPQKLSQTGCFDPADPRVPTAKLVHYDVNSPLWSDGAEKARWMALPDGGKVHIRPDGDWDFPVGAVLVKEFKLAGKLVETRLFVRHTDGGWAGYTYEWDANEKDATLLLDGKTKPVGDQSWTFPSRSQCMTCHNTAAGNTLGLETAQLNRGTQLDELAARALFDAPLPAAPRPALADPAGAASAEDRARSYLHANCSFCHRPGGPGRGAADFRFDLSFADTHLCNTVPDDGTLGIPGAKLLVPSDPSKSLISARMHRTNVGRMPPLATSVVDATGTSAVDAWISGVTSCP
jgi:uncharacterized repeat protein (TIGR03806 family)